MSRGSGVVGTSAINKMRFVLTGMYDLESTSSLGAALAVPTQQMICGKWRPSLLIKHTRLAQEPIRREG